MTIETADDVVTHSSDTLLERITQQLPHLRLPGALWRMFPHLQTLDLACDQCAVKDLQELAAACPQLTWIKLLLARQ